MDSTSPRARLQSLLDQAYRARRKRKALDVVLAQILLQYDDEEKGEIKRKRNTGRRPGGRNPTGRPDYENSSWARMLRDKAAELEQLDSAESIKFRRRFRLPYPIFLQVTPPLKSSRLV